MSRGYFLPPGWILDCSRSLENDAVADSVVLMPGGMRPPVLLAGPPRTEDKLAALIREYLAADPLDATATVEFLLRSDAL